jgi:hypothetical protein
LCAEPLSESHTGDYLAGKILLMLESFAIGTDRVHVVLRDGGANMVKAMRVAELPDLSCFAHTLQLVVHDCILSQRAVIDVLAVARQIVGKFRHSILAQDRLKVLQEAEIAKDQVGARCFDPLEQHLTPCWTLS